MLLLILGCASDSNLGRVKAAPLASIESPTDDQVFRQSADPIVLSGTVSDEHDLPDSLTATWTLDETAPVPATPDPSGVVTGTLEGDLALGAHLLTLTVTDGDGLTGSATLGFSVEGPLGAPVVEITSPADGSAFELAESITFTGLATDTTTPADDLQFAWRSDLDGELAGAISGDGQSALITAVLSLGTHVITLDVTDLDGEIGTDSIAVTVGHEEPVEPEPGDLIFSEIMVNPQVVADEDGEWVELYNTSGYTLDISGYSFHDDATDYWVFDAAVEVEPHGYMVLCANVDPARNGGIPCDGWFYRNPAGDEPDPGLGHGSGIAIANNDDELELTSPASVDIDRFDYNDTDSDPIEDGVAFGLSPDKLDGTSNDDILNWCVQTTILPGAFEPGTPGQANDPCPATF